MSGSQPLTEAQRALAGSHTALVGFVAYEFTSDPHQVACLASVGHLALCRAAATWESGRGATFGTYARVVVRNAMRSEISRLGRRQASELPGGIEKWNETLVDPDPLPGEDLARRGTGDLMACVESLPEELRQIVIELVVEGVGTREAGRRRGRSNVWAWTKYHQALELLREEAKKRGIAATL